MCDQGGENMREGRVGAESEDPDLAPRHSHNMNVRRYVMPHI